MKKDRKEIILQSGRKLFAKYELKKAAIDDIASEARVGKATIYYYFKSKHAIFKGVVEREWPTFKNAVKKITKESFPEIKLQTFILTGISHKRKLVNLYRVAMNIAKEIL